MLTLIFMPRIWKYSMPTVHDFQRFFKMVCVAGRQGWPLFASHRSRGLCIVGWACWVIRTPTRTPESAARGLRSVFSCKDYPANTFY